MLLNDSELLGVWRDRVEWNRPSILLQQLWSGDPPERRAVIAAAHGDLVLAGAIAGGVWEHLAKGDLGEALRQSRGDADKPQTMSMAFAEAEALIQAGAVVAGLERLGDLHAGGLAAATLSLARHCYRLGDHRRVLYLANSMPGHAQLALTGAKSAMLEHELDQAEGLLAPYLEGALPVPGPLEAGAFASVAATFLAKRGEWDRLRHFAGGLLNAPDFADEMIPSIARVAWCANLGHAAWEQFDTSRGPWGVVGRLELAMLSGIADVAQKLMQQAGALAAPAQAMMTLLQGGEVDGEECARVFAEGRLVHVWRTHPTRWQPWLDALDGVSAEVAVYDLARNDLPDEQAVPHAVLDDGALITLLAPKPATTGGHGGRGVWVDDPLCGGVGIGHDWPEEEMAVLTRTLGPDHLVDDPEAAALWVVGAEQALAREQRGDGPLKVVIAPPGDPFWAGPLPARAWPAMRVVRKDPDKGWAGQGLEVGKLALAQLQDAGRAPGMGLEG